MGFGWDHLVKVIREYVWVSLVKFKGSVGGTREEGFGRDGGGPT